jgi:membrane associated rhomboid family serine protease
MKKISGAVKTSVFLVAILWLVFLIDVFLPADLRGLGLRPRDTGRVWGVLTAPFLHGDMNHLIANSGALLVLLTVSFSYNRKLAFQAIVIVWILGGCLVWFFASGGTVHI